MSLEANGIQRLALFLFDQRNVVHFFSLLISIFIIIWWCGKFFIEPQMDVKHITESVVVLAASLLLVLYSVYATIMNSEQIACVIEKLQRDEQGYYRDPINMNYYGGLDNTTSRNFPSRSNNRRNKRR